LDDKRAVRAEGGRRFQRETGLNFNVDCNLIHRAHIPAAEVIA